MAMSCTLCALGVADSWYYCLSCCACERLA